MREFLNVLSFFRCVLKILFSSFTLCHHVLPSPSRLPLQMSLNETEALMFDPESRERWIYSCWWNFFFFLFVFCSLPVWVDKSAWCLFSYGQKEQARRKKHQAALLYPFHAWTCGSSSAPGGTLREHFIKDQKKLEKKGEKPVVGSYFLSGCILGND